MTLTLEKTAVDSLCRANQFLGEVDDDSIALKWFVIAIHHALHCFMLSALNDGGNNNIWVQSTVQKLRNVGNLNVVNLLHEDNKLLSFLAAYKKIQNKTTMQIYTHSKYFIAEPQHTEAMKFLNNELRNVMIHYKPITFGVTPDYVASCLPVMDILNFLLFDSGNIVQLSSNKTKLKNITDQIKEKLIDYARTCD